jgi:hypothetical protein
VKRLVSALALAAVVAITGGPVHATEVPGTLSFTARLVDDKSDAPVAGAHSVVFALFDAEAAGHSVWNETHSVTIAEDGLVFVELGDTTALDSRVFDGTDRWLEITVDGNVMSPRIVLDSVPYAVRSTAAANADAVGGKTVDQLQPKLTGSCNNGQHIQNIGADGSIQCASDSSATGDITAVVAGTGLAGGAAAGDATVSLMACAANQILKFTGAGWACAADNDSGDITAVTAGSGLIGGGSSGAVTIAMTNTCTAGQLLKWNGTAWTCAADIDTDTNSGGTITGVTAGPGLIGGGTSGTVALSLPNTCASGQVLKWSGATWMCANDLDTDTNSGGTITGVTAGAGLTGGGTTGTATVNVGQGVGIVVQADTVGLDTAFTDTRYLMLTGGTMAGAINMNGFRVTNRGCPVGYVKVGTAFCTESQDTSGLTFTGAASHCAATGAHLCSSAEARAIIALGTTLSDNMLLDWVDDQDADGSALYINNATASEDPDGVRATSTSSYARCCVNLE